MASLPEGYDLINGRIVNTDDLLIESVVENDDDELPPCCPYCGQDWPTNSETKEPDHAERE